MTDWTKIQIEYEQGAKPKELAKKYKLTAQQISRKATASKWISPKKKNERKVEKSREKYDEQIENLFGKCIIELNQIINDPETRKNDKINAIKCVIDISGYKKERQDIKNLTPQIIVADEKQKGTLEKLRNANLN